MLYVIIFFHQTNKQSRKVMVSACVSWNGATKPFSVKDKKLKVNSKSYKKILPEKNFFSVKITQMSVKIFQWKNFTQDLLNTLMAPRFPGWQSP